MNDRISSLFDELATACERHHRSFGDEVVALIGEVERSYRLMTADMFGLPSVHLRHVPTLKPLMKSLTDYTRAMRWVGWGNCALGPPLNIRPVEEYTSAIAVYISARLIDDAIDGHTDYKGYMATSYGFLLEHTSEQVAAGLGAMTGCMLAHAALQRLMKQNRREAAELLLTTYAEVIPGALAEILSQGSRSAELYSAVVAGKSVAYDMMLHRVFLRTAPEDIRTPLLAFLATFSETAQWLNDLFDADDDRTRNQLNFVNSIGIDRLTAQQRIGSSFLALWQQAGSLPPHIRDALATRLRDPVDALLQSLS